MTFLNIAPLTSYSASSSGGFSGTIATFTVGKTGQYFVAWNNRCTPDGNGNNWVNFSLIVAGTTVSSNIPTAIGIGVDSYGGGYWQGHCNNGDTISLTASQNGGSSNGGGALYAYFIPTPTERI